MTESAKTQQNSALVACAGDRVSLWHPGFRVQGSGFRGASGGLGVRHDCSLGAGTLRTVEDARASGWGQIVVAVWRWLAGIVGVERDLYEL